MIPRSEALAADAVCDQSRGECVECLRDADCSGNAPVCDHEERECVQCVVDADCDAGGTCQDRECRDA
jgi:Cys-rich repeat protein